MIRRLSAMASIAMAILVGACSEKDKTAPPAPILDTLENPTTAAVIAVTGSAEYGSTITITGGLATVTAKADPFTARFKADVALNTTLAAGQTSVTTSLSVVATDAAGNVSDPATIDMVYGPAIDFTVSIDRVNGYYVCPVSGILTDKADLSDCATRVDPAVVFRRGALIIVSLKARDDRGIQTMSYRANGSGISVTDTQFVGDTAYHAGDDLIREFNFTINRNWAGDVTLVAQASDDSSRVVNSPTALLHVNLDIEAGDRKVDILAAGPFLVGLRDVGVTPGGQVLAVSNDASVAQVFTVTTPADPFTTYYDFWPVRPESIALDAAGNMYNATSIDEVWRFAPGTTTAGTFNTSAGNPEGLFTLGSATPMRGPWDNNSTIAANACIAIPTGASSRYIFQVNNGACVGTCSGGSLNGLTANTCVQSSSGTVPGQAADIVTSINATSASHGFHAAFNDDCNNLAVGAGNGGDCIYVWSDTPGATPPPAGLTNFSLVSNDGNWVGRETRGGANAGLLFIADTGGPGIIEVQTPPGAGSAVVNSFDFGPGGWRGGGSFEDVVAAVRKPTGAVTPRLFSYLTHFRTAGNTSEVIGFDSARNSAWILATSNNNFPHVSGGANSDSLREAWGIVYVPGDANGGGDCLVVSSRAPNGASFRGELLAYRSIDTLTGATLENNLPMVTGFDQIRGMALDSTSGNPAQWSILVTDTSNQIVVRIGRSAATNDCF